jgi:ankyrin repeat protein
MALALLASRLACAPAFAQPVGSNALSDAALRGDAITARKLLDGGADPNARDEAGSTPLMYAVSMTARRASGGDFLATGSFYSSVART